MVIGVKIKLILLTQEYQDMRAPVFPPSTEAVTRVCPGSLLNSVQRHRGQILDKLSSLPEDVLLSLPLLTPEVSCPTSQCLSYPPGYVCAPALQL